MLRSCVLYLYTQYSILICLTKAFYLPTYLFYLLYQRPYYDSNLRSLAFNILSKIKTVTSTLCIAVMLTLV